MRAPAFVRPLRAGPVARGMTLLEMMVAITIVAVVAGLGVTSFQTMADRGKAIKAMREIYTMALRARQTARSRNEPVRLNVAKVKQNGLEYTRVRWELLPCANRWGTGACPDSSCEASSCDSGCPCLLTGEPVLISPRAKLDVDTLDHLCFLGGSGIPVVSDSGKDCQSGAPNPTASALQMKVRDRVSSILVAEPATGVVRLVNCEAVPKDPVCP